MPRSRNTHKDVEFHVSGFDNDAFITKSFKEASAEAVRNSIDLGEKWTGIYVVVHSEAGAKWWMGEEGVRRYREDPEASVFDKINVKAQSEGMIP